jgi:hypothetical protein
MIMFNIKTFLLFIFTCITSEVLLAQQVGWEQINTKEHELAYSIERASDGNIWMAAVRHPLYVSKRRLLIAKMTEEGLPIFSKEMDIPGISVHTTGGIFEHNHSQRIVFCTFSIDTPFRQPLHWGYLLFDSVFNLLDI